MTDDFDAVEGSDAGYVPCDELAAPTPAVNETGTAISGLSEGYVAVDDEAGGEPSVSDASAAVAGFSEGYVANPCGGGCAETPLFPYTGLDEHGGWDDETDPSNTSPHPFFGPWSLSAPGALAPMDLDFIATWRHDAQDAYNAFVLTGDTRTDFSTFSFSGEARQFKAYGVESAGPFQTGVVTFDLTGGAFVSDQFVQSRTPFGPPPAYPYIYANAGPPGSSDPGAGTWLGVEWELWAVPIPLLVVDDELVDPGDIFGYGVWDRGGVLVDSGTMAAGTNDVPQTFEHRTAAFDLGSPGQGAFFYLLTGSGTMEGQFYKRLVSATLSIVVDAC